MQFLSIFCTCYVYDDAVAFLQKISQVIGSHTFSQLLNNSLRTKIPHDYQVDPTLLFSSRVLIVNARVFMSKKVCKVLLSRTGMCSEEEHP